MSSIPTEDITATKTRAAFRRPAGELAFWIGLLIMGVLFWQVSGYRYRLRVEEHRQAVETFRRQKDRFLKGDSTSPLQNKADFQGLAYYPINFRQRHTLRLLPRRDTAVLWLPTTADTRVAFVRAGWVQVPKPDGGVKPVVIVHPVNDPVHLLLSFTDSTTGEETASYGRYLDVVRLSQTHVLVDFNLAYHPYCLFNKALACPEPPEENALPFAVRAGERLEE